MAPGGFHPGQPEPARPRAKNEANPKRPAVAMPELIRMLAGWAPAEGPIYRRLAERLADLITDGTLPAGTLLPAERTLARELEISRRTVEAAGDLLSERGLIQRRTGVGTWCTPPAPPASPELLPAANEEFIEQLIGGEGPLDLTVAGPPAHPLVAQAAAATHPDYRSHGYLANGLESLVHGVCDWFADHGVPTRPAQIAVTSGAAQALWLAAALLPPGSDVRVENPTSPTILTALRAHHLRLSTALAESPAALFVTPSYLNPSGAHMPPDRCRAVAQLARRDTLVVEDLVLADIRLDGPPARTIAALAPNARILSIGSMSKLFWGGLRVGWIRGPEPLIRRITRMKIALDIATAAEPQAQAAWLLERRDLVRTDRIAELRLQRDALVTALHQELPAWQFAVPDGGLSLWARLPGADAESVQRHALRHGPRLLPARAFRLNRRENQHLRLPYVHPPTAQPAIVRLLRAAADAHIR